MKRTILIASIAIICLTVLAGSIINNQNQTVPSVTEQKQVNATEEYAIVEMWDYFFKVEIITTIGNNPTVVKEIKRERGNRNDYTMVIKELNDVNSKGYQLFDSSVGIYKKNKDQGVKYHAYIFMKKL